ncbi:PRD domain-containing protein [Orbus sturtevantii]|uniref:PRD domain-containing protein n=1 Tax=Orbus sturtevantii TaxID=3074109 RepID=UPI00370DBED7
MYKIIKIINNNVVLVLDKTNRETIVIGKGIGFSAPKGGVLHFSPGNQIFIHKKESEILDFIDAIPVEIIQLTSDIIQKSERFLNEKLSDSLIITLSEHILFAIKRFENSQYESINIHEVPFLYLNEYEVGCKAVEYINKVKNIQLPQSEASLIALHFVNARLNNSSVGETLKLTKLAYQIANIICYHFHIKVSTGSLNFSRFIIHLKLLIARCRALAEEPKIRELKSSLVDALEKEFLKNYTCAKKIVKLISDEYDLMVPDDEVFYLAIHIERLLHAA